MLQVYTVRLLLTYILVTVIWKTDLMVTNTEVHLLYVHGSHTHALSKHLRIDGRSPLTGGFVPLLLNHEGTFHGLCGR